MGFRDLTIAWKTAALQGRKPSYAGDNSPTNCLNAKSAISFVTSALGQQVHESLEIIEDADEVEEEELDNINIDANPPQDTSFDAQ